MTQTKGEEGKGKSVFFDLRLDTTRMHRRRVMDSNFVHGKPITAKLNHGLMSSEWIPIRAKYAKHAFGFFTIEQLKAKYQSAHDEMKYLFREA